MIGAAKLKEIVDAISFQSEDISYYYNKKTAEVIMVTSEMIDAADNDEPLDDYPEWEHEGIAQAKEVLANPSDFLCLPTQFDIHEWEIINSFCLSVEDPAVRNELLNAIRGNGAFRMFKSEIERYQLEDKWFAYREEALKEIVIDWCDSHGLQYSTHTER